VAALALDNERLTFSCPPILSSRRRSLGGDLKVRLGAGKMWSLGSMAQETFRAYGAESTR